MPEDTGKPPSDTHPSPPPSGALDTEIALAAADDLVDAIEGLKLQVRNLEAIETLLRREATR